MKKRDHLNLLILFRIIFSGTLSRELQAQDLGLSVGLSVFINIKENYKFALEMKGIFRTSTHTALAFDAVGFSLVLAYLELHGTDFFALLAANAFVFFKFQLVSFSSKQALCCPHRTERTPGSRAQETSEKDCNCGGHKAHHYKDHAYLFESIKASDRSCCPVAHKAHQQEKDRQADPEAPECIGYLSFL